MSRVREQQQKQYDSRRIWRLIQEQKKINREIKEQSSRHKQTSCKEATREQLMLLFRTALIAAKETLKRETIKTMQYC